MFGFGRDKRDERERRERQLAEEAQHLHAQVRELADAAARIRLIAAEVSGLKGQMEVAVAALRESRAALDRAVEAANGATRMASALERARNKSPDGWAGAKR